MAQGLFTLRQVNQAIRQGAWTTGTKTSTVEYLVVAGGGGAGNNGGGGGGGGGLLTGIVPVASGSSITVTVGAGGATSPSSGVAGVNGTASVFGSISSAGGGGGGYGAPATAGTSGGSGGGGSSYSSGVSFGVGGQPIANQGNKGGDATYGGTVNIYDAGGGGAGMPGTTNPGISSTFAPTGGSGIASAISGTVTAYAGGGGGYLDAGGIAAAGGVGGGGAGGYSAGGTAGTANTGGGGGGNGAAGGSGRVIVSYPDVYAAPTATTGSPTVSTSGSGSLLTTGTPYLRYAGQTPFSFGTGDFTIEMWAYRPAGAVLGILFDFRFGSNGAFPYLFKDTDNLLYYYVNSASRITSSVGLTANAWSHIAICRSGTVTTMYINGASVGTWTDTTNYSVGASAPTLFADNTNLYSFTGNVSNVRIVKGVCVYTGAFTPPTGPLQATQPAGTNISAITGTQTSLLLNTVSGAYVADSSTNSYSPINTIAVTPPWNALSPFTGTGYKNRVYTWTSSGSITF